MKHTLIIILIFSFINSLAQEDTTIIRTPRKAEGIATKVFYSQKLINTKTVEVLPKGILDFSVTHNFGDIAGDRGGLKNFFGLDDAADVKIAFQLGLSDKFNLLMARTRGTQYNLAPLRFWELGAKWQLLQQLENDAKHPLSLTLFGNIVASSVKSQLEVTPTNDTTERSFDGFSDRLSEVFQIMIAKKFGNVSLQLNPIYVHRNLVQKNFADVELEDKNVFAIGGAARIPLTKKIFFIIDYFHPFISQAAKDSMNSPRRPQLNRFKFYDPLGVGIEIVTEGHVFNLNFTNATDALENRLVPHTFTSWGDGQYRWGFTISRKFVVFKDRKNRN